MKVIVLGALLALPMALAACDDPSATPAMNTPTLEQQGFDPGAANLEMCADGAMREDCSVVSEGA